MHVHSLYYRSLIFGCSLPHKGRGGTRETDVATSVSYPPCRSGTRSDGSKLYSSILARCIKRNDHAKFVHRPGGLELSLPVCARKFPSRTTLGRGR